MLHEAAIPGKTVPEIGNSAELQLPLVTVQLCPQVDQTGSTIWKHLHM